MKTRPYRWQDLSFAVPEEFQDRTMVTLVDAPTGQSSITIGVEPFSGDLGQFVTQQLAAVSQAMPGVVLESRAARRLAKVTAEVVHLLLPTIGDRQIAVWQAYIPTGNRIAAITVTGPPERASHTIDAVLAGFLVH